MAKNKTTFTSEQENQITELYLNKPHTNPDIRKAMGLSRAVLNNAIAFFQLPSQFEEKYGMSKSQYMVSKINLSTDNPECPHTGENAIRHWYIDKMLSATEIAFKLGLMPYQIRYKIKIYNLVGRKPKGYKPRKERIKDLTTIITLANKPRQITRDFTAVNKKYQPNVKSNFDDAKKERNKVCHLLQSDLSTLDITQLTTTTCRGINTNNGKDTFCLEQIDPSHTYCQHHRSIYCTRQTNNA
jgi:hypothetical protein